MKFKKMEISQINKNHIPEKLILFQFSFWSRRISSKLIVI